jgi:hypothetical protein
MAAHCGPIAAVQTQAKLAGYPIHTTENRSLGNCSESIERIERIETDPLWPIH